MTQYIYNLCGEIQGFVQGLTRQSEFVTIHQVLFYGDLSSPTLFVLTFIPIIHHLNISKMNMAIILMV